MSHSISALVDMIIEIIFLKFFIQHRCWSVLAIVPQHSVCLPYNNTDTMQMSLNLFDETQGQCVESPSLEK
jgi:hypothetical protein